MVLTDSLANQRVYLQNQITSLPHLSDLRSNYKELANLGIITNSFDSFLAKKMKIREKARANIPPIFLLFPEGFL